MTKTRGIGPRITRSAALALLTACGLPSVSSAFSYPPSGDRLAQAYPQQRDQRWLFRPQSPSNARGMPPAPIEQPAVPSSSPSGAPAAGAPLGYPPSSAWQPGGGAPYGAPQPSARQYWPSAQPGQSQSAPSGYGPAQYSPGAYGSYAPARGSTAGPTLEVKISDDEPYVQEPVLLRLRVISDGNLATASPDVSGFEDVLLEKLSGPETSTRGSGRARRIVNEYTLTLTPLHDGVLEVGPFSVSGTLATGAPFEATGEKKLRLMVRPAIASVRPWLPLQSLELTRKLQDDLALSEGRPVTLILNMKAGGASGTQLPSLESFLRSPDFRAYREQTLTDTRLSDDNRRLIGTRTEYYTLVPHSGGRLQLPAVRVGWWDVQNGRHETSGVPIQSLSVKGKSGPFGFARSSTRSDGESGGLSWVWMPLAGLLLLLIGYWAGVWYHIRLPRHRENARDGDAAPTLLRPSLGATTAALRGALAGTARRFDPRPLLAKTGRQLAERIATATPQSMRVYRCAQSADRAETPAEWALAFQHNACRSLRTPSQEPLPRLADRILQRRPGADAARVRRLLQQLDSALYRGSSIDFGRWKRDFRTALRPGVGAFSGLLSGRIKRARLPALNPRHSA